MDQMSPLPPKVSKVAELLDLHTKPTLSPYGQFHVDMSFLYKNERELVEYMRELVQTGNAGQFEILTEDKLWNNTDMNDRFRLFFIIRLNFIYNYSGECERDYSYRVRCETLLEMAKQVYAQAYNEQLPTSETLEKFHRIFSNK